MTSMGEICSENSIFTGHYHPGLELVMDFLPHKQWLELRGLTKYTKRIVDLKLGQLRIFSHEFKDRNSMSGWEDNEYRLSTVHAYFRRIYVGLRDMTPNLFELPISVNSILTLGGFPQLRKLKLHWVPNSVDGKMRIDAMVKEVTKRASILESLEFSKSLRPHELASAVLDGNCTFPMVKSVDLSKCPAVKPVLGSRFASNFPNVEKLSLANYWCGYLRSDFEQVLQIANLRCLQIGDHSIDRRSSYRCAPIPLLQRLNFPRMKEREIECWTVFFAGAECLTFLRLGIELPALESSIRLLTRNLPSLQTLELTADQTEAYIPNSRRPLPYRACHRLYFNLPKLEILTIRINGCLYSDERTDLFLFEDSIGLKINLKCFKFLFSCANSDFSLDVRSLLCNFLSGCESLEEVTITEWGKVDLEPLRDGIHELKLPNLREINIG